MPSKNPIYYMLKLREKVVGFMILIVYFRKWYSFVLLRIGLAKSAMLIPRAYVQRELKSIDIRKKTHTITVIFKNSKIKFYYDSARQLDNSMTNIFEDFAAEQYRGLDVDGMEVVDVGANVGDTALYFATRGAKKVYAYEPYPYSCKLARRNIRLNRMQNRIVINNELLSARKEPMLIDENYMNISSSVLENFDNGKRVKGVNLEDIVTKYRLNGAILKLDCEGAEYDAILKSSEKVLRRFSQIAIEYHYGYQKLVRKLKDSGFKVEYTEPQTKTKSETGRMLVGTIFAYR